MKEIIESMRPRQWVKNVFVLAPLLFALQFGSPNAWFGAILATISFILVSGSVYIINDIFDAEADRKHPTKKKRPIASGRLQKKSAIFAITTLFAIGILIASLLSPRCFIVMISYFIMNLVYSKFLKDLAIIDVLVIASGFVLRVIMGGYAISVPISPWIIIATFMLTLFIGFGKRRHEVRTDHGEMRESLSAYNKEFLDKLINVTCAGTFISYAIYAVETADRLQNIGLVFTTVFVAFGIFRYLQHIYFEKEGGAPEEIIFKDRWFAGNMVLWLITTLFLLS